MTVEVLSVGSSQVDSGGQDRRPHSPVDIVEMIELQAAQYPLAPAVVCAERSISYDELVSLATALALRLRKAGLQSGQPVAIYLESSIEMVVAELATWKAGGAYLPIDPAYPAERTAYIMSDSGAPIILTRHGLTGLLPPGPWSTLCVDEMPVPASPGTATLAEARPDDLAYVIYTSGSTGQPKGVEITHGNLLNLIAWHTHEFEITRMDRAAQIAGPGFDAAVWELWPYLTSGAAICIPPPTVRLSSVHLRDWLLAQSITIAFAPTVLAEQLLPLSWPIAAELRYLLTGGDALHQFPSPGLPFQLINNYGPTECTVVATSTNVSDMQEGRVAPPIGLPILNTSLYLLDETRQPVVDGGVGEIYITGANVGRGYRNRPELTAASFCSINVAGRIERAFRTGDLAVKTPDGQYSFVGRADDQIKIRGFRIEPDEIAYVINQHPAVASSAVIARSDEGNKRLVAYVVLSTGHAAGESDLREFIIRYLPDYMVPAQFVSLHEIPVNANGKLDKSSLPAPSIKNRFRHDAFVAPRSQVEEIIEGLLLPILSLERISVHDNFFLLGGHSLMGAQLIARVRDTFGVELSLRDVFTGATVADLASKIEALLTVRLESMSEEDVNQALCRQTSSSPLASDIAL